MAGCCGWRDSTQFWTESKSCSNRSGFRMRNCKGSPPIWNRPNATFRRCRRLPCTAKRSRCWICSRRWATAPITNFSGATSAGIRCHCAHSDFSSRNCGGTHCSTGRPWRKNGTLPISSTSRNRTSATGNASTSAPCS
ncbi:hypothetical protein SDC9_141484 [bioreactor metagenome]|uniref:Uncharacterized protein n=1 Tax=bioreactor metagenome TaxID=1076179 RepID=A0A645DYW9_9ZZZZ